MSLSKRSGRCSESGRGGMIIEVCGPPGVGKTTLGRALTTRLRERGVAAEFVASYRPSERMPNPAGWNHRSAAASDTTNARAARELAWARRKLARDGHSELLLRSLPPRSMFWPIRLRQYIWRLARAWFSAPSEDHVVIFDQAFVQLICTLVLLSASAKDTVVARALNLVPKPDILIRLNAPRETLRERLVERYRGQSWMERLLELDMNTNLRSIEIFARLQTQLARHGRWTFEIDTGLSHTSSTALDRLAQNIVDRLTVTAT